MVWCVVYVYIRMKYCKKGGFLQWVFVILKCAVYMLDIPRIARSKNIIFMALNVRTTFYGGLFDKLNAQA